MLPTIDPSQQAFLSSINRVQGRLDRAQRQVSSGLKIAAASDAPDEVAGILQLQADIRRNQDVKDAMNRVQTEVDTGEQTLSASVELMEQASVIATQATSTTQTAETRATLAAGVQSLLEQMVSNSRASVDGRYVFGGDLDQSPAYQLNLANSNGVDRLQLSGATKQARGADGGLFNVGASANEIFDHRDINDTPDSNNVFASLNGLRVALLNNDLPAIQSSITALGDASRWLNNNLSAAGLAQGRITSALNRTSGLDAQLRAELGSRQDADTVAAILDLNQSQLQLQAAMQARAKAPQQSLFELL